MVRTCLNRYQHMAINSWNGHFQGHCMTVWNEMESWSVVSAYYAVSTLTLQEYYDQLQHLNSLQDVNAVSSGPSFPHHILYVLVCQ